MILQRVTIQPLGGRTRGAMVQGKFILICNSCIPSQYQGKTVLHNRASVENFRNIVTHLVEVEVEDG